MAQFGRPINDVNIAWEINNSTGLPDFYTSIDEVVPDDATTFLESINNHGTNSIFDLSALVDPGTNEDHILRVRCFGTGGAFNFYLKQGGVTIFERLNEDFSDGSWRTVSMTLSEVEASAITDYSDLTFEFNVPFQGNRGQVLYISQAEFEIPDAAGGGGGNTQMIKTKGEWKSILSKKIMVGGVWKDITDLKLKTKKVWKNT